MYLLSEDYVRVRMEELHREAEALHLARLAQPRTRRPLLDRLADVRCRALDMLAGLGFAIQSCVVQPMPPQSR